MKQFTHLIIQYFLQPPSTPSPYTYIHRLLLLLLLRTFDSTNSSSSFASLSPVPLPLPAAVRSRIPLPIWCPQLMQLHHLHYCCCYYCCCCCCPQTPLSPCPPFSHKSYTQSPRPVSVPPSTGPRTPYGTTCCSHRRTAPSPLRFLQIRQIIALARDQNNNNNPLLSHLLAAGTS